VLGGSRRIRTVRISGRRGALPGRIERGGGGEGGGSEQALTLGMTGGRTWCGFTRMIQDTIIWKIPIPTEAIFLGVNQVTPTISQNV
jgi:hypothetical protein